MSNRRTYRFHICEQGFIVNIQFDFDAYTPVAAIRFVLALTRSPQVHSEHVPRSTDDHFYITSRVGLNKVTLDIFPEGKTPENFFSGYSSPIYNFLTRNFKDIFVRGIIAVEPSSGYTFEPLFVPQEEEGV